MGIKDALPCPTTEKLTHYKSLLADMETESPILASSFPFQGEVVTINSNTTIHNATKLLVEKGITSAPVYDEPTETYLGFYDLADGLSLVLGIDKMKSIIPASKLWEQTVSIHGISIDLSLSENGTGTDIPVSKIMTVQNQGRTQSAPWYPIKPSDDLVTALRLLAMKPEKPWSPCRRVPVVNPDTKQITKVITQSAIVSALYDGVIKPGIGMDDPLFIQTPRSSGIGLLERIFQADESTSIYNVFSLMTLHQISAVPIVGQQSKLVVDCITNKDIGCILGLIERRGTDIKSMTAAEFINVAEQESVKPRSRTVIVAIDTPVNVIVSKLALNKVHRVFIAGDDGKLIGVFSVSDAVKAMFENNFPWPRSFMVSKLGAPKSLP